MMNEEQTKITNKLKECWIISGRKDEFLQQINFGQIIIDNYKIFTTSGHRAFVGAKHLTTGEIITIFDCRAPDNQAEFFSCLRQKLDT